MGRRTCQTSWPGKVSRHRGEPSSRREGDRVEVRARMTAKTVDAIIFDMDGLLIDSEPLWRIAEVEMLSAVGVPITKEDAVQTTGLRTDEVVELGHPRYPWSDPPQKEIAAR